MSSVMIRCPTTGSAVATGIETEPAVFRKLPKISSMMACPACGEDHVWSVNAAWLSGEPWPLRLVPQPKIEAA
jgi:hypothetical protein